MVKLIPTDLTVQKDAREIPVYFYETFTEDQKEALLKRLAECNHTNDHAMSHISVVRTSACLPTAEVKWFLVGQKPIIQRFWLKWVDGFNTFITIPI